MPAACWMRPAAAPHVCHLPRGSRRCASGAMIGSPPCRRRPRYRGRLHMPTVQGNGIDIYYEVQGDGEPLVLIPYLAADQACYAFQVAEYAKHFTCFTVDLRGAGLTRQAGGHLHHRALADDIAAFMHVANVERAHVARPVPRRGDRHVAGRQAPGPGEVAVPAQRLGPQRPVPAGGRRELAGHGAGAGQRHRHGDQGDLPLVLHPGALRGAARVHRLAGRLRARPPDGAGGRVHAPVGGGAGPRRPATRSR